MSFVFRSKLIESKSGYFSDSVAIGAKDASGYLHVVGGDLIHQSGYAYFDNKPLVSGIPVLLSGEAGSSFSSINDLSDVDTQTVPPVSGQYLRWDGSSWTSQSGDGGGAISSSDNIDLLFKQAYDTYYHELSYNTSGALTGVGVWDVSAKTTQLYVKQLNYSGEYLTGVVVTDVISANTLTKTLSYDGNDNLISATRIYT